MVPYTTIYVYIHREYIYIHRENIYIGKNINGTVYDAVVERAHYNVTSLVTKLVTIIRATNALLA